MIIIDPQIHRILRQAAADPGAFAGHKGERMMGDWIATATLVALAEAGYRVERRPSRSTCASPDCALGGVCMRPETCPERRG